MLWQHIQDRFTPAKFRPVDQQLNEGWEWGTTAQINLSIVTVQTSRSVWVRVWRLYCWYTSLIFIFEIKKKCWCHLQTKFRGWQRQIKFSSSVVPPIGQTCDSDSVWIESKFQLAQILDQAMQCFGSMHNKSSPNLYNWNIIRPKGKINITTSQCQLRSTTHFFSL